MLTVAETGLFSSPYTVSAIDAVELVDFCSFLYHLNSLFARAQDAAENSAKNES